MIEPTYIETWEVAGNPNGNRLKIAYTRSVCPSYTYVDELRRIMAEEHNCTLVHLLRTDKILPESDENDETK